MPSAAAGRLLFSCNCILNDLYAGCMPHSGRKANAVREPVTFGEFAYQLVLWQQSFSVLLAGHALARLGKVTLSHAAG
jgi:hypothetical protein